MEQSYSPGRRIVIAGISFRITFRYTQGDGGPSGVTRDDFQNAQLHIAHHLCQLGVVTGESYRYMRKALDINLQEAAAEVGEPESQITAWEAGNTSVPFSAWMLMALKIKNKMNSPLTNEEFIHAVQEPHDLPAEIEIDLTIPEASRRVTSVFERTVAGITFSTSLSAVRHASGIVFEANDLAWVERQIALHLTTLGIVTAETFRHMQRGIGLSRQRFCEILDLPQEHLLEMEQSETVERAHWILLALMVQDGLGQDHGIHPILKAVLEPPPPPKRVELTAVFKPLPVTP